MSEMNKYCTNRVCSHCDWQIECQFNQGQLNKLKAENEELMKEIEDWSNSAGTDTITCKKLKQALQEIKEILTNLKVQNSKEIQNKPTSGYYIPSEMHYGRCEARIEIADKILQKISEVEE